MRVPFLSFQLVLSLIPISSNGPVLKPPKNVISFLPEDAPMRDSDQTQADPVLEDVPAPIPLSRILKDLAQPRPDDGDRIPIGVLMDSFGQRALGLLIFIFALPNVFPLSVPGFTAIMGVPVILLLCQVVVGREKPWLPRWVKNRTFSRSGFAKVVTKATPALEWMEKFSRPRLQDIFSKWSLRMSATFMVVTAVVMTLPLPLTNVVPAIAISIWSLGLVERDGRTATVALSLSAIWLTALVILYTFFYQIISDLAGWWS